MAMTNSSNGHKRACPGCGADLTGTHGRRKWCSEQCRKSTLYGGVCLICGERTDGSNGRTLAPSFCKNCSPAAHARWSKERVAKKIQEWARRYGRPPSVMDWSPSHVRHHPVLSPVLKQKKIERFEQGDWPSYDTAVRLFGSWPAALRAAGFDLNPSGTPGHWEVTAA